MAPQYAKVLTNEVGWNVNITYTLIKRYIKKGAIERSEPGFMCQDIKNGMMYSKSVDGQET